MAVLEITNFDGSAVATFDFTAMSRELMVRARDIVLKEAQDNARQFRDTGALTNSLQARTVELSAEVGSPLPYARAAEYGRPAGAAMPPVEALSGWAERRGIDEGSLYVIARAIGRRGIEGRFFLRRAYESLDKQMPTIIDNVAREAGL